MESKALPILVLWFALSTVAFSMKVCFLNRFTYLHRTKLGQSACCISVLCPSGTEPRLCEKFGESATCSPCSMGMFQKYEYNSSLMILCERWTECGNGQIIDQVGSATSDQTCTCDQQRGFYKTSAGSCVQCPVNTELQVKTGECRPCKDGYENTKGLRGCYPRITRSTRYSKTTEAIPIPISTEPETLTSTDSGLKYSDPSNPLKLSAKVVDGQSRTTVIIIAPVILGIFLLIFLAIFLIWLIRKKNLVSGGCLERKSITHEYEEIADRISSRNRNVENNVRSEESDRSGGTLLGGDRDGSHWNRFIPDSSYTTTHQNGDDYTVVDENERNAHGDDYTVVDENELRDSSLDSIASDRNISF